MIVLHEPGIIFLKSRKTAGSSLEIALSAFAGEDDVITPIDFGRSDDKSRSELGYRGAQNYRKPIHGLLTRPTWRDWRDFLKRKPLRKHHDHSAARRVRWHFDTTKWHRYSKISIVRNPWDYMVSSYYWANRDHEVLPDFQRWCLDNDRLMNRNHRQYFIGNQCVIDHFLRFERLLEDLRGLEEKFPAIRGVADIFSGMNAKKGVRPKTGPSLDEIYRHAPQVDQLIRERCRFEIETFGYQGPKMEAG